MYVLYMLLFTVHTKSESAASTYKQVKRRSKEKTSWDHTAKSHSTLHYHKSFLSHHSCKYTTRIYLYIFYTLLRIFFVSYLFVFFVTYFIVVFFIVVVVGSYGFWFTNRTIIFGILCKDCRVGSIGGKVLVKKINGN